MLIFVGANATPDVLRAVERYSKSVLFEPLPDVCKRLQDMVAGHNCEVVCAAVSDLTGKAKFHRYNVNGLSSSLGTVTSQAVEMFPKFDLGLQETIEVETVNLYDWIQSRGITFIQRLVIDAQGMDLRILKTIEPLLRRKVISEVKTEADGGGFQHYAGLGSNSIIDQVAFMRSVGYYPCETNTVAFHPDIEWGQNEDTFEHRLERMACRVHS